jgi:hypothetical protein
VLALRGYAAERMQRDADTPRAISLKTLRCVVADARGEQLHRIPAAEEGLAYDMRLAEFLVQGRRSRLSNRLHTACMDCSNHCAIGAISTLPMMTWSIRKSSASSALTLTR